MQCSHVSGVQMTSERVQPECTVESQCSHSSEEGIQPECMVKPRCSQYFTPVLAFTTAPKNKQGNGHQYSQPEFLVVVTITGP